MNYVLQPPTETVKYTYSHFTSGEIEAYVVSSSPDVTQNVSDSWEYNTEVLTPILETVATALPL